MGDLPEKLLILIVDSLFCLTSIILYAVARAARLIEERRATWER